MNKINDSGISEFKANDLRIGNLVYRGYSEAVRIVESISKTSVYLDNAVGATLLEDLTPIPLTPEWLIRFGFEKKIIEDDFDRWVLGGFDEIWQHDEGFCHSLHFGADIPFVHTLQNLYYPLTGSELIFTD